MSHDVKRKEIVITKDLTIPKLWLEAAKKFGDQKIAMREKEFGIWQEFTWKEYHEHVRDFSLGLVSLGFKPGDNLAIMGPATVGATRGGSTRPSSSEWAMMVAPIRRVLTPQLVVHANCCVPSAARN